MGRHMGLVQTIRNLMQYMAALLHVCFLLCLEPLAAAMEASEFLYLSSGKLLNHMINEWIGTIIRALPLKESVTINGEVMSLTGPVKVAAAMKRVGVQLQLQFGSRETMREKQLVFAEEAGRRVVVADLLAALDGKKRRNEAAEKEEATPVVASASKKRKKLEKAAAAAAAVKTAAATAANTAPRAQAATTTTAACARHIASLLLIKDSKGSAVQCLRGTSCNFSHQPLKAVTLSEAKYCVAAIKDGDLRSKVTAKLVTSVALFKP
jgi:hypothetical protein